MGFAISWFAVSGKPPAKVLEELGLVRTGESEEFPESPITCACLESGWFVVAANRFDSPLVAEKALRTLSDGCTVVSCQVEEHVMFSSASCYSNGARSWHVAHDSQDGIYHLVANGNVPREFGDIHATLRSKQEDAGGNKADVDYIQDVPIVLAKGVTGYRHDEDIPGARGNPFEVLRQVRPTSAAKPWWKLW